MGCGWDVAPKVYVGREREVSEAACVCMSLAGQERGAPVGEWEGKKQARIEHRVKMANEDVNRRRWP